MKTIRIILLLLVVATANVMGQKNVFPTKNLDAYVGTWVYQNNDTVFKIRLQRGQIIGVNYIINGLYGGYFLSVKGRIVDNYWGELPTCRDWLVPHLDNQYIWATNSSFFLEHVNPNFLSVQFFDQRKKHFNGKGIWGGYIKLLSPTKIHWRLDELLGIRKAIDSDDTLTEADCQLKGFSVPDDVIMMKE